LKNQAKNRENFWVEKIEREREKQTFRVEILNKIARARARERERGGERERNKHFGLKY